jgi:hypothetical protein
VARLKVMDEVVNTCLHCGKPITSSTRGRPSKFCSDAHRKAYSRLNGQNSPSWIARATISHKEGSEGSERPLRQSAPRPKKMGTVKFSWDGLTLYLGRKSVLTLVADDRFPHLFRIRYPNGWLSPPANLSRAKDAAYCHARHLLGADRGQNLTN